LRSVCSSTASTGGRVRNKTRPIVLVLELENEDDSRREGPLTLGSAIRLKREPDPCIDRVFVTVISADDSIRRDSGRDRLGEPGVDAAPDPAVVL